MGTVVGCDRITCGGSGHNTRGWEGWVGSLGVWGLGGEVGRLMVRGIGDNRERGDWLG